MGIRTVLRLANLVIEKIKSKVKPKQKRTLNSSLVNTLYWGNKNKLNNIPSFAESNVPDVVGEINLLWESCCNIIPQIESPAPVKISVTVRGILLIISICRSECFSNVTLFGNIDLTPIRSDATVATNKIKYSVTICITLVLFFK